MLGPTYIRFLFRLLYTSLRLLLGGSGVGEEGEGVGGWQNTPCFIGMFCLEQEL